MATRRRTARKKKAVRRKKTTRKKATGRKKSTRKKATGRKKSTRKKASRRKKTTRKKAARRKKTARKKTTRKKAARRKKPTQKKSARRKAPARRKPAARKADPMKALATKIVKAGQNPEAVDFEELYDPRCESYEAGSPEPAVGYAGLREKMANWAQMQEGTTFKPINVWTGPNTVSVEWDGSVKLRGGPTVSLREVAVHEIRGGKIVRERYFYNPAALAPPQAAAPEPASSEPAPWRSDDDSGD